MHCDVNFWSSTGSSDTTFLLKVVYFSFVKNLLFLLQSVSWTVQPKHNTQSVATSNDFVAKIILKVVLSTCSKDLIWDLFIGHASKPEYKAGKQLAFNSSIMTTSEAFVSGRFQVLHKFFLCTPRISPLVQN